MKNANTANDASGQKRQPPDPLGLIYTPLQSMAEAEALARAALDKDLCACANVIPAVRSFFRWDGQVSASDEVICLFKTTPARMDQLMAWIEDHHPYDEPAVIALAASANSAFVAWCAEETKNPDHRLP